MRVKYPNEYTLLGFEVNHGPDSKYFAVIEHKTTGKIKKIPFGGKYEDGTPYEQYKDRLGHYSAFDHKDKERRRRWLLRHGENAKHKFSSAYFSKTMLW